jgi:hypothetical protein
MSGVYTDNSATCKAPGRSRCHGIRPDSTDLHRRPAVKSNLPAVDRG